MERREFVVAAGASGLAALTSKSRAAAAQPSPLRPPVVIPDMDTYLSRMDAGMERIGRWSPSSEFPAFNGDRAAADSLARKSLRTLYATAMFADLPRDKQADPRMQERMWAALPEMDEAMDEMEAFLRTRSHEEWEMLQAVLQRPEEVGARIAQALDHEAEISGVSEARRAQTRELMEYTVWRLRNQPPELLVNEYLEKVEKVGATDIASAGRQQWLASRVGEEVFWQQAQRPTSPRERTLKRGAKAMGIGLLIDVVGGLLIAAGGTSQFGVVAGVGVFGLTVGTIWFLVGLITVLVGLALSGTPDTPAH